MIKKLLCICLLGAAPFIGKAQELNARITINSDKVQSTNKQVFKTLQDALNDFVNNKKWTDATFAMNETYRLFHDSHHQRNGIGQ